MILADTSAWVEYDGVAAVAWRRDASLLAQDADLDRVAGVIGVPMDPASLRA